MGGCLGSENTGEMALQRKVTRKGLDNKKNRDAAVREWAGGGWSAGSYAPGVSGL